MPWVEPPTLLRLAFVVARLDAFVNCVALKELF